MAGVRPAMRTEIVGDVSGAEIDRWRRRLGLFGVTDADGFIVLSRRPGYGRRLLALDRSPGDHTMALGLRLGYPACCARAASRIGEAGLDGWGDGLRDRRFMGRFALIRIDHYAKGAAAISHIPCSPSCLASLSMALKLKKAEHGRKAVCQPSDQPRQSCVRSSSYPAWTKRQD